MGSFSKLNSSVFTAISENKTLCLSVSFIHIGINSDVEKVLLGKSFLHPAYYIHKGKKKFREKKLTREKKSPREKSPGEKNPREKNFPDHFLHWQLPPHRHPGFAGLSRWSHWKKRKAMRTERGRQTRGQRTGLGWSVTRETAPPARTTERPRVPSTLKTREEVGLICCVSLLYSRAPERIRARRHSILSPYYLSPPEPGPSGLSRNQALH